MRYDKSVYVLISVLSSEHTILKAKILNDGIKIYKKLVLCYIEMSYTHELPTINGILWYIEIQNIQPSIEYLTINFYPTLTVVLIQLMYVDMEN